MSARPSGGPAPVPVAAEIAEELPGLEVLGLRVPASRPMDVRARLRAHADRLDGPRVLALRAAATPSAYRALFRQLGIEPDRDAPPLDRLLLRRMRRGGFPRRGPLRDVLDLATLETSVPVWALDGATGPLELRLAAPGEALDPRPAAAPGPEPVTLDDVTEGDVVLADAAGPVQALFGPAAARAVPGDRGAALLLVAVGPPGVPRIAVEEALWTCQEALDGA